MSSSNAIVVYSAIFGRVDKPWAAPAVQGVDFVVFTDDVSLRAQGWRTVVCSPAYYDPRKSAKIFKVLPHRYLPEYQLSIWVDGTSCPRGDPRPLIESTLKTGVATFVHPERDCIYDEAAVCIRRGFDPKTIEIQMARYRAAGYPAHHGLNTCTVIVREHNAPHVVAAMEEWWSEIERGSIRDQLSFNYVLWRHGLTSDVIPGHVYWNAFFHYVPHGVRHDTLLALVESQRHNPNRLWRALLATKDALGRSLDRFRK